MLMFLTISKVDRKTVVLKYFVFTAQTPTSHRPSNSKISRNTFGAQFKLQFRWIFLPFHSPKEWYRDPRLIRDVGFENRCFTVNIRL
jgi:hypothetical protein